MKGIVTDSFHIIITLFRCVGLYYNRKQSQVMKIWKNFLSLSCVLIIVLSFMALLVEKDMDITQLNQLVVFIVEASAAALKVLIFMQKISKIKKCVYFFECRKFAPKSNAERRILSNCVYRCQRNVKMFVGGLTLAGIYWNTLPFFNRASTLPIKIWLPYDVAASSTTFYLTYLYVAMVIAYLAILTMSMEPFIGGLAFHALTQLKILKYNLRHQISNDKSCRKKDSADKNGSTICEKIKCCIAHYNDILVFVKMYEECFSWCIFSQIAATLIGLCFCCIGLTWVSPASMNGLMFFGSCLVILSQLFFYCHYGTLLYEENNGLIGAVFMSPWYTYGVTERKMLITIMEKSKEPIILSAGKVINLTYETFTSVVKSSYSLIAVLNNGQ